jgi:hypothetical protein
MKLYTLYATPGQTADFVMVASLSTIIEYLQSPHPSRGMQDIIQPREGAGECALSISAGAGRIGYWMIVRGARLPQPEPVGPDENIGSLHSPEDLAAQVTR